MKTYSFEKVKNIDVFGDCYNDIKTVIKAIKSSLYVSPEDVDKPHPKELERKARMEAREALSRGLRGRMDEGPRITLNAGDIFNITKSSKSGKKAAQSNSLLIYTGNCGIGNNKYEYYTEAFEKLNKILAYNKSYVVFIRGNNDDPSYFDGKKINFSNIKAVPDYSVIDVNDKKILCVGGAISVDRVWKKEQEKRINSYSTNKKTLYWENEAPKFNKDLIDEITKSFKVDYVISYSAPSFVTTGTDNDINEWATNDPNLIEDVNNERLVMDKVFEELRDSGVRPIYWAFGHFGGNFIEKRSNTIFRSLNGGPYNSISITQDITNFNYIESEKYKKGKSVSKIEKFVMPRHLEEPDGIGEQLDERDMEDNNDIPEFEEAPAQNNEQERFEDVEMFFDDEHNNGRQAEPEREVEAEIEHVPGVAERMGEANMHEPRVAAINVEELYRNLTRFRNDTGAYDQGIYTVAYNPF